MSDKDIHKSLNKLKTDLILSIEDIMQRMRHSHITLDEGYEEIRKLLSNDN